MVALRNIITDMFISMENSKCNNLC